MPSYDPDTSYARGGEQSDAGYPAAARRLPLALLAGALCLASLLISSQLFAGRSQPPAEDPAARGMVGEGVPPLAVDGSAASQGPTALAPGQTVQSLRSPFLAPPAAPGVTRVRAVPDLGCVAGSACSLRVEVALDPTPVARAISWSIVWTDLCDDAPPRGLATAAVPARAGWTEVVGHTEVQAPSGRAPALIAVTEAPARAASPPALLVARQSC